MQTDTMPATREEALRRLRAFEPRAGRDYAANRNYDRGSGDRSNVSTLAPYIRHRLITEEEVLRAVLERFRYTAASKFVQEVFWRTYWKGWLEAHPAVWHDYGNSLAARLTETAHDDDLAHAYANALAGQTGIEAFDAWAHELIATGYLHNHARMWFASIWIFTLLLPWELGADFFMRYLACGDPASNTLSWRWVAGLHTRGKTYLARRSNIERYTAGRFDTGERLRTSAPALAGEAYAPQPLPELQLRPEIVGPAILLLHDDDAGSETMSLEPYDVRASLALLAAHRRSPQKLGAVAAAFARNALTDALSRAPHGAGGSVIASDDIRAVADAVTQGAAAVNAATAITGFAPVGPVRDTLNALRAPLAERGVTLVELGRRYDALSWPHATRGYFSLRAKIPTIVRELSIAQRDDD